MSLSPELETLLLRLCTALEAQTEAINHQAQAICVLAESNEAMADAMVNMDAKQGQDDEQEEPTHDLAGRPIGKQ